MSSHRAERRLREEERMAGLLCDLQERSTPLQDWLLRVGPTARRMNEEAQRDG